MTDWRRIDIDSFDRENGRLRAADLVPQYDTILSVQDLQGRINEIRSFAMAGDVSSAVGLATREPAYNADAQAKAQYLHTVLEALLQVRQADIANIVRGLTPEQQDVLCKYLYSGMAIPEGQKQGGVLLLWFEKLTEAAGLRPVMHYLNDRNTVS